MSEEDPFKRRDTRPCLGKTDRRESLRLDPEIIDFFRGQGPGFQTRMNQVLRSYVEAQQDKNGKGSEGRKAS